MQNGNQWQNRKSRFNNSNNQHYDYNNKSNNSDGNWVQQKSHDNLPLIKDEKKSFDSNNYQGGNKRGKESLAPPPTPPNLPNVQNRLGRFGNKDHGSSNNNNKFKNPPNMNSPNKMQQSGGQQRDHFNDRNRDQRYNAPNNRNNPRGRGPMNFDKIKERVNKELSGPQLDLPPLPVEEKKFNSQCRLFIGNISRDANVDELKEEFAKFGELGQIYFNKDNAYGFVSFDFKHNAEKAMREMQGKLVSGRSLTVRFAAVSTGIKVKNLSPHVSNELLEKAFNVFGPIEACRISVDNRGKPTGEGIIIFSEKKGATLATKKCDEDCYFLTSSLRPVVVEPLAVSDEGEGMSEASMNKNDQYRKEREIGPHFADPASFQYEYGLRWKQLFYLYNEKKQALEHDFNAECDALAAKLSLVKHEYETEQLRRELAAREAETSYLHAEVEYRMNTASFSNFHSPMPGESSSYDNHPYEKYDRGQQQYDRSYNHGYGYDHGSSGHGGQSYDGSYNQGNAGNYDQTYNRNDMNTDCPATDNVLPTSEQISEVAADNQAAPALTGRLAGRLQDKRQPGDETTTTTDTSVAPPPITDVPGVNRPGNAANRPSLDRSANNRSLDRSGNSAMNRLDRSNNLGDLSRSLNNRQDGPGDLNLSLSSRQDSHGDLNISLNNRQDNLGDLNRSLSSRQDGIMGTRPHEHPNQGDQPMKRIRY